MTNNDDFTFCHMLKDYLFLQLIIYIFYINYFHFNI